MLFLSVLDTQETEEIICDRQSNCTDLWWNQLRRYQCAALLRNRTAADRRVCDPDFSTMTSMGRQIVVLAAAFNSLKLIGKSLAEAKSLSMAVVLLDFLLLVSFCSWCKKCHCRRQVGILNEENDQLPPHHAEIAKVTNRDHLSGDLQTALKGADIFIGVSAPGALKKEWTLRWEISL